MMNIRELLQTRPLLFDGAMGTYYKAAPGVECEQANLTDPAGVLAVHREYLAAGADAVKTNTFSLPRLAAAHAPGWEQLAQAGWQLAVQGRRVLLFLPTLARLRIPRRFRRGRYIRLWQSSSRRWGPGISCSRP
jgi:hypothetical protein